MSCNLNEMETVQVPSRDDTVRQLIGVLVVFHRDRARVAIFHGGPDLAAGFFEVARNHVLLCVVCSVHQNIWHRYEHFVRQPCRATIRTLSA